LDARLLASITPCPFFTLTVIQGVGCDRENPCAKKNRKHFQPGAQIQAAVLARAAPFAPFFSGITSNPGNPDSTISRVCLTASLSSNEPAIAHHSFFPRKSPQLQLSVDVAPSPRGAPYRIAPLCAASGCFANSRSAQSPSPPSS